MKPRTVVLALGNRDRGDDGVGPAIADALKGRLNSDIRVVETSLEQILDILLQDCDNAIILDACTGLSPGTVLVTKSSFKVDHDPIAHGLGFLHLLRIMEGLKQGPKNLRLIFVAGRRFEPGEPMTDEVAAAIPEAVKRVEEALAQWV